MRISDGSSDVGSSDLGGDGGVAEEAVDGGDEVGRDMLKHRRVGAADRQVQRAARFLSHRKADHRGLGDVGESVADNFAPAAEHRRSRKTVVQGTSGFVRVDLGSCRNIKKKNNKIATTSIS